LIHELQVTNWLSKNQFPFYSIVSLTFLLKLESVFTSCDKKESHIKRKINSPIIELDVLLFFLLCSLDYVWIHFC